MALTGELSDLSLAELIEFFCNQRKTGCLKVIYPKGAGYFYLKAGAVIHARFGDLRGIDAVYYALTQTNASFTFSPAVESAEHTINQPWTSVVLEGLRRMDEGVAPPRPSAESLEEATAEEAKPVVAEASTITTATAQPKAPRNQSTVAKPDVKEFGAMLSASGNGSFARRRFHPAMVVVAVVLLLAGVGIPWALYSRNKAARAASQMSTQTVPTPAPAEVATSSETQPVVTSDAESAPSTDPAELARRQREARARERAKQDQAAANQSNSNSAAKPATSAPPTSNKRATVTVTYDENGRVTAASGGDATALRIARQKRFPPGKPGSATITIPIN